MVKLSVNSASRFTLASYSVSHSWFWFGSAMAKALGCFGGCRDSSLKMS